MNALLSTTLHSTKDGADKVYVPAIVPNPAGGFDVIAENGRRGGTLTRQKAKVAGVDEATARAAYERLVTEKIKGGYRPLDGEPIAVAAATARDGKRAGIPVQLLNPISEAQLVTGIELGFCIQEKHDGERRLVVIDANGVSGVNRNGEYVPLPPVTVEAVKAYTRDAILDAEIIGETLHVFDVQRLDGRDLTQLGFLQRFRCLTSPGCHSALRLSPVFTTEIPRMVAHFRERGAEGVVARNPGAPYTDGRPGRGGNALKFKFYNTASVEVIRHNAKHSIGVAVYNGSERVDVGNVTLPPSMQPPAIGSVCEVRYLYAYRGGALYQPTFLAVRSDVSADAFDSLVFKGEGA